ncbi:MULTISPECIES: DUF1173 domain-containing protein [Paraburkholderia]|uniref:DUF1173 domain-containing protein n=1 Tax=Paraburkholderia madseniana TaxID=2599607 RepID=A0AAP5BMS7_9BURK|nr:MULTISPECIES: DUF1173 domain-containing protein [Paraburkholderia]MCX4151048.1 DUF1173 domain-containing protein [Paraburkholderia madseniana]MCX4176688.1 DUF1173 domain-containing protein [Paraburkholderia madseniana]MDN7153980.1 DUF1173 domain-containing protein [Paraburkholderia sp. WS6]MDQ6412862.1 DUF1173 domain-containing protein [Paraburkholderia madseniana]MDQ6464679.1 DUF1173 domain-containing protein [Paraburkholderia madseniana]
MHYYLIDGRKFSDADHGLQAALARVHHSAQRPLCLCTHPGVPMYVAKVDGHFQIKRMPDSGARHAAECESFEPPAALSGLGEVLGHAIKEDVNDGLTTLRLDFALNKIAGRAPPAPSGAEPGSIKAESAKLTIRSLLHYLWDSAHLTHWNPRMAGKRSWATVHKYLLRASEGNVTKGMQLASTLYVPEPFYLDRKAEIVQRRAALISAADKSNRPGQKLFIVIGDLKEITEARYGWKMTLKQVPDFPFMISTDLNNKLKVFRPELDLWNAYGSEAHFIVIATFGVGSTGVAQIEEMSVMVTNEQWIPFSNVHEKELIDSLIAGGRRFVKGLAYNLPKSRPLACAVLTDTQPTDTAIHLVPANAPESYQTALADLIESSRDLAHIQWISGEVLPAIPPAVIPDKHDN